MVVVIIDLRVDIAAHKEGSLLKKDYALNIQQSFNKYLYDVLDGKYYINYSGARDEKLQKRIKDRVKDYWRWLDINWLKVGPGIFSISLVQISCCSIIKEDPYKTELMKMHDEVQGKLNIDSIVLFDFLTDPEEPEQTDNVLIPRYRGSRPLPDAAGDTVNVFAIDFNIYVYRESILP